MMNKGLENQVAVVTGGNLGIGRAISIKLAKMGAKVMVIGRNAENNEETKKLIEAEGGYAECYVADVAQQEQVNETVEAIQKKHERIDILIANAGITTPPAFITDFNDEDWHKLLNTHINGTYYFVKACGKIMRKNNYGRIVLMSSIGGIYGLIGNTSYTVAKAGIAGLCYNLAKELGPFGITVNCLQPGIIRTDMTKPFLTVAEEEIINETPVRRIGEPEDVAHMAAFYCLPESNFVTGTVITVDGGYVLQVGLADKIMFGACNQ